MQRMIQAFKTKRFLIMSFVLLFSAILAFPLVASAHNYSASFTNLKIEKKKTEMIFTIDTLSLIELISGIDKNKNFVLDSSEVQRAKPKIEELLTESLALDKNNKEQNPKFGRMRVVKKQNSIFVECSIQYPVFSPGDTISLTDGFYTGNSGTTNYVNLLAVDYQGEKSEGVLQGNDRNWTMLLTDLQQDQQPNNQTIPSKKQPLSQRTTISTPSSTWFPFFKLGMLHILSGIDHLLFLFALLLRKQTFKQYASIITSFTIAHSITLSLAVLGLVTLPSRFVEAMIAFSICYVSIENIFRKKIQHRWTITFLFGLIHGLGFATILREMSIPKSHLAIALVNFNLGIEAVQLSIVLFLLPLLVVLFKLKKSTYFIKYGSIIITLLGAFWLFQRLFI